MQNVTIATDHKRGMSKIPRPPGASVELPHVSAEDAGLVRHRGLLDAVSRLDFPFPQARCADRGIVICGGGERYLPSAYVLVRVLRHLGCGLPVEVWHLGEGEMPHKR